MHKFCVLFGMMLAMGCSKTEAAPTPTPPASASAIAVTSSAPPTVEKAPEPVPEPVVPKGLCQDLTTWVKPLVEAGDDLAGVVPRFKKANLEAPDMPQKFMNFGKFEDETTAKAKDWRKKEADLKALTIVDGEEPLRKNLLAGYDTTATGYEKLGEAFHKRSKGLSDVTGLSEVVKNMGTTARAMETDLKKKCEKIGG